MKSPSGYHGRTNHQTILGILYKCIISCSLFVCMFSSRAEAEHQVFNDEPERFTVTAVHNIDNETGISREYGKNIPVIPDFPLTVVKTGTGSGTIIGPEMDCGTICSGVFPKGTVIVLTADPDSGSVFVGWAGGGCSTSEPCAVTLERATEVTAKFKKVYKITAVAGNHGAIFPVDRPPTGTASDESATVSINSVDLGSSLTFRITSGSGYHVEGIEVDGIPAEIADTLVFPDINSDHTITVTFVPGS